MTRTVRLVPLALAVWAAARLLLAQEDGAAPLTPALVTSPVPLIGITPCRIVDTRDAGRPPGYGPPALQPGNPARSFVLANQCGIPSSAQAVSLNVTVVSPQGPGYILLYPQGGAQPVVSTLNYLQGQTVANAAIVPLGSGGITVAAAVSGTQLIIDTNGYYGPSSGGYFNTFVGGGNGTTEEYNTAAGHLALFSNTTGASNTAIGSNSLRLNTSGMNNTAFGASALENNSEGNYNTAINSALPLNTTGEGNTALGQALQSNTTGSYNTTVGGGYYYNATGSGNTSLLGGGHSVDGNSNLHIGDNTSTDPNETTTIRIGQPGQQNRTYIGGIFGAAVLGNGLMVFVDTYGQLGTIPSSLRFKEDVEDMAGESVGLHSLRPVTFRYRGRSEDQKRFGLIAEEVETAFPDLVVRDADGTPRSVFYHELPALLLNELQDQARRIETQDEELRAARARLERQREEALEAERRIEDLRARLSSLDQNPAPLP
jgi:hypothetical protein